MLGIKSHKVRLHEIRLVVNFARLDKPAREIIYKQVLRLPKLDGESYHSGGKYPDAFTFHPSATTQENLQQLAAILLEPGFFHVFEIWEIELELTGAVTDAARRETLRIDLAEMGISPMAWDKTFTVIGAQSIRRLSDYNLSLIRTKLSYASR